MAKSENLNKGRKQATRNKVILGAVIAAIIIAIIGYFVYILGIVPKLATGMKVTGTITTTDGDISINEKVSVLESRFHYVEAYNASAYTYYMYGITDFDMVADPETGKTFNDLFYDQAAKEMMNIVILNELADRSNDFYSAADRYVDMNVSSIRRQAEASNYTADVLLQNNYGTGMTVNQYRNFMAREMRCMEFEEYMKQFVLVATPEEIQASYDANPTAYEVVDFNSYYFPYETNEAGEVADTTAATASANAVVTAVSNGEEFRSAVISAIGVDAENITKLSSFGYTLDENGEIVAPAEEEIVDPTFRENWTSAEAETYRFNEYLFANDTVAGSATTVEADNGIYVVSFASRHTNDTTTVVYRTLTLNTGAEVLVTPEAELNAAIADTTARANNLAASAATPFEFARIVKDNTDSMNEIITGGIQSAVTAETFQGSETVNNWMFDDARATGDTYVEVSEDGKTVTIYYIEYSVPAWMDIALAEANTSMVNDWSNLITSNVRVSVAVDLIERLTY